MIIVSYLLLVYECQKERKVKKRKNCNRFLSVSFYFFLFISLIFCKFLFLNVVELFGIFISNTNKKFVHYFKFLNRIEDKMSFFVKLVNVCYRISKNSTSKEKIWWRGSLSHISIFEIILQICANVRISRRIKNDLE